jgi:OmpA-OmpF porin, OOP family
MKKQLLLLVFLLSFVSNFAQTAPKQNIVKPEDALANEYNRWSVELDAGQSKGVKPYAPGYYYSNPNAHIKVDFNHFGISGRYMISPKFGIKSHLSFDKIKNQSGSGSLPFEMSHTQITFEGVVNTVRLFNFEKPAGRFGLLFHLGLEASAMTSHTTAIGHNNGFTEYNGGIIVGITPQLRIFKNVSIFADFTANSNVRQHFNWDGSYANSEINLTGALYTTSVGVSVSLGKDKIHGDWAIIPDKNLLNIDPLEKRIGDIETLMNDTDKDGVPDYLDQENNSVAGVAVDTKGRMVDLNKNGVPDELERYITTMNAGNTNIAGNNTTINDSMIAQLINEGYIAAYFDTNKRQPTNASSDNIGFILNYLKNNPTKTIDIVGYADVIGSNEYNQKLSNDRAENIKLILEKAGISESRMSIKFNGADNTVDKTSEYARRLVRKVVFKIK